MLVQQDESNNSLLAAGMVSAASRCPGISGHWMHDALISVLLFFCRLVELVRLQCIFNCLEIVIIHVFPLYTCGSCTVGIIQF